ncbi:MAG: DUF3347 domain-containing protein [Chitinophagaceae bacterium]|nr:DUF3347 domain-containing protein [Chitinophagaceae bacterium]
MKKLLLYCAVAVLAACGSSDEKAKVEEKPQGPLAKSANSAAFNESFGAVLADYYALKESFVADSDTAVDRNAKSLMLATDNLKLNELKGDTNIIATAKTYTEGISAELKGLLGEKDMEGKRKSFQMVGDQLYDLIRTVQYDRAVVYHQFCPMAFNDQGANWLSSYQDIRNPYIPKKMLTCGETKDSIDFRPKQ